MAEIRRGRLFDIEPSSRIIEAGGRMFVRLIDAAAPLEARQAGMVPVCDMGGNIMVVPGSVVMPYVTLDGVDAAVDADGDSVLLTGWQASVN